MKNLLLLLLVGALGVAGYFYFIKDKETAPDSASASPTPVSASPSAPASGAQTTTAAATVAPAPAVPVKQLVKCARCDGTGLVKCPNPKCKDGTVECNGPCLRLTKGRWEKMEVAGHPPTDVWQVFRYRTATGQNYKAWSQHHLGEVIQIVNGVPENMGACKICHGTTRVPCTTCQGKAQIVCPVCHGEKMLDPDHLPSPETMEAKEPTPPAAGTAPAQPEAARSPVSGTPPAPQPNAPGLKTFKLKDGTTIVGKVVIQDDEFTVIRTSDGKSARVKNTDLEDQP